MKLNLKKSVCTCLLTGIVVSSSSQDITLPQQNDRWKIEPDGSIVWKIDNRVPHADHIEMAGQKVALWMQYGVDTSAAPRLTRTVVFPSYRLLPVKTNAHMTYNVEDAELPRILINDKLLKAGVYKAAVSKDMPEKVISIRQKGIMQIESEIGKDGLHLRRSY